MTKHVLDVGQCGFDHSSISRWISTHFDADVRPAHDADQALQMLRSQAFDLVLVNRRLDRDHSDGMDIIRQMKADDSLREVPVMLVTNFPDHQAAAQQEGAAPGFGKAELNDPAAVNKLAPYLGDG